MTIGAGIALGVGVGVVGTIAAIFITEKIEEKSKSAPVVDRRSVKEKFEEFRYKAKQKAEQFWAWVSTHPIQSAGIVTLALSCVSEVRRIYDRVVKVKDERKQRLTVYCGDVQSYVRLRHELNYKENRELRDRMSQGQTKFEALDAMGLLV